MNIRTGHAAGRTGLEHARRHVDLITGSPDTSVCVRLIRDLKSGRANQPASNLIGSIATLWPRIQAAQTEGHGAFLVVNEGGHRGDEITRIRAAFVDADGLPLPDAWEWHVTPDFLVRRDRAHCRGGACCELLCDWR